MAKVVQRTFENGSRESVETLLRRFKKKVLNENLMQDLRKKDYYVSPSLKKRLKHENYLKLVKREEIKRLATIEKKAKQFRKKQKMDYDN